jgi:hypothetical protein
MQSIGPSEVAIVRYHEILETFDDPQPNREQEERASRRIVFAVLVVGAVMASLYGLGAVIAAAADGI